MFFLIQFWDCSEVSSSFVNQHFQYKTCQFCTSNFRFFFSFLRKRIGLFRWKNYITSFWEVFSRLCFWNGWPRFPTIIPVELMEVEFGRNLRESFSLARNQNQIEIIARRGKSRPRIDKIKFEYFAIWCFEEFSSLNFDYYRETIWFGVFIKISSIFNKICISIFHRLSTFSVRCEKSRVGER